MKLQNLTLCGLFLGMATLTGNSFANEDDTATLRQEINRLYEDISQSAHQLPRLTEQTLLDRPDNATLLAALERLNRNKPATPTAEEITAARNKIESYKMLCHSAKGDTAIFVKYCSPTPYQNLSADYSRQIAK